MLLALDFIVFTFEFLGFSVLVLVASSESLYFILLLSFELLVPIDKSLLSLAECVSLGLEVFDLVLESAHLTFFSSEFFLELCDSGKVLFTRLLGAVSLDFLIVAFTLTVLAVVDCLDVSIVNLLLVVG